MERLEELDGVRGVAILMVMTYHIAHRARFLTANLLLQSFFNFGNLGWAGVDVFFVLSGFLITNILLRTRDESHYFRNFYARRILRIFPLYYLFISIVFPYLPWIDKTFGAATQSLWPFFLLYQQNWLFPAQPISPFVGITWSLAIEEQFYFVWPTVVRWLSKQRLVILCLVTILVSLAVRIILVTNTNDFAHIREVVYFFTLTRLDGLMMGALIAVMFSLEKWTTALRRAAWPVLSFSFIPLFLIARGGSEALADNPPMSVWSSTLFAVIAGALIILVTTQPARAWIRVVFRHKILRFFGKYSYSMYLFHMPLVLAISDYYIREGRISGVVCFIYIISVLAGTIALSLLSWHLLEKHALGLKKYFV